MEDNLPTPPVNELREGELTYPAPEHGWTCFHCGTTFHSSSQARRHFGADAGAQPGCVAKLYGRDHGLLHALRGAEENASSLHEQLREVHQTKADELQLAWEKGYEQCKIDKGVEE